MTAEIVDHPFVAIPKAYKKCFDAAVYERQVCRPWTKEEGRFIRHIVQEYTSFIELYGLASFADRIEDEMPDLSAKMIDCWLDYETGLELTLEVLAFLRWVSWHKQYEK